MIICTRNRAEELSDGVTRIAPSRIDDCYMINRALSYGVEWPRIAYVLGEAARSDLLGWASSAMRRLLTAVSWTGELSVQDVLGRISSLPDGLVHRANMAQILGELAVSAALLEHDEVVAGECRLRIQQDTLLRGILADPAPRR